MEERMKENVLAREDEEEGKLRRGKGSGKGRRVRKGKGRGKGGTEKRGKRVRGHKEHSRSLLALATTRCATRIPVTTGILIRVAGAVCIGHCRIIIIAVVVIV